MLYEQSVSYASLPVYTLYLHHQIVHLIWKVIHWIKRKNGHPKTLFDNIFTLHIHGYIPHPLVLWHTRILTFGFQLYWSASLAYSPNWQFGQGPSGDLAMAIWSSDKAPRNKTIRPLTRPVELNAWILLLKKRISVLTRRGLVLLRTLIKDGIPEQWRRYHRMARHPSQTGQCRPAIWLDTILHPAYVVLPRGISSWLHASMEQEKLTMTANNSRSI